SAASATGAPAGSAAATDPAPTAPAAPTPAPAADDDVARGNAFRDRMCACKDAACARQVSTEIAAWGETLLGKKYKDQKDVPGGLMVAMTEAEACQQKLGGGAPAPSNDPDVAAANGFRDRMCACKDAACAASLTTELEAWGKGLEAKYKTASAAPEALMKAMMSIAECEAKVPTAPATGATATADELGTAAGFKEAMCACKDAACARQIEAKVEAWGKTLEQKYKDPTSVPPALMKTMMALAECDAKAQGAGAGAR
ncbi:MAG: hypothetical protein K8W52_31485, partial [Deltaproteobacteria bacterium]|nr:hypothetical protein [Deltaproteobacteria bacterium]